MTSYFTKELILGEGKRYWGTLDKTLYFFNDNSKGYMLFSDNSKSNFIWQINKDGILAIKNENSELVYIKINNMGNNDTFSCKKYIKVDNKLEFIDNISFTYRSFEDIELEELEMNLKSMSVEIKNYKNYEYFIFISFFILYSILFFFIINQVSLISNSPFWISLSLYIVTIILTLRNLYTFVKIIIKFLNETILKKKVLQDHEF